MLQRLTAAVLGVLGLIAIALGIASATAWRADDTLTATAQTADGTTLLTTAPGLLELGDPPATISARAAEGTTVVLALGRDTDVAGWVGADAHTVITGLSDWHTFTTRVVTGEDETATDEPSADASAPAPAATAPAGAAATTAPTPAVDAPAEGAADPVAPTAAPDPAAGDLWVDEATGEGSAELVWTPREGRWTLLAAATGEDPGPLTVELSWPQTVTTPWLVPGVAGGAVLLLIAALLAWRARRAARRDEDWYPMTAVGTPAVAGPAGSSAATTSASTAPAPDGASAPGPSSATPRADGPADAPGDPYGAGPGPGAPRADGEDVR